MSASEMPYLWHSAYTVAGEARLGEGSGGEVARAADSNALPTRWARNGDGSVWSRERGHELGQCVRWVHLPVRMTEGVREGDVDFQGYALGGNM